MNPSQQIASVREVLVMYGNRVEKLLAENNQLKINISEAEGKASEALEFQQLAIQELSDFKEQQSKKEFEIDAEIEALKKQVEMLAQAQGLPTEHE